MSAGPPSGHPPRIIAGAWRGRKLSVPAGITTRPTSSRARQAAFDILLHAPWAGPDFLRTARVLDVFAGTGAFGLEALSRGAAFATFIESSPPALRALASNIAACKTAASTRILRADALRPPPGTPHDLIFLDPPYGQNLAAPAVAALTAAGWISEITITIAELGPNDEFTSPNLLAERRHGKARMVFFKTPQSKTTRHRA